MLKRLITIAAEIRRTRRAYVVQVMDYVRMAAQPEISQRDLRERSQAIMDAVESGQAFTVTRAGRPIGELIPLPGRRRFVPREEFAAMSRTAPAISFEALREGLDAAIDQDLDDPFDR